MEPLALILYFILYNAGDIVQETLTVAIVLPSPRLQSGHCARVLLKLSCVLDSFSALSALSQITVLRYGVALVNECGLKQWYIMY